MCNIEANPDFLETLEDHSKVDIIPILTLHKDRHIKYNNWTEAIAMYEIVLNRSARRINYPLTSNIKKLLILMREPVENLSLVELGIVSLIDDPSCYCKSVDDWIVACTVNHNNLVNVPEEYISEVTRALPRDSHKLPDVGTLMECMNRLNRMSALPRPLSYRMCLLHEKLYVARSVIKILEEHVIDKLRVIGDKLINDVFF
jgi:hypothetical protein